MDISHLKKDFIRHLKSLDNSRHLYDKFNDFLELSYCALAKQVSLHLGDIERADKLEAQYMKIVNRYIDLQGERGKDIIRGYPALLSMTAMAMQYTGHDFLGEVASEMELLNKGTGQFFTPYNVAKLMAKMTFHGYENFIAEQGYFTALDPAVGGGVTLLTLADEIVEVHGYDLPTTLLAEGWDVSHTAYYMSYIQFTLKGIAARLVHGNSLSMEVFTHAWTGPALRFYEFHGHMFDEPHNVDDDHQQPPLEILNQLPLFK